MTYGRQWSDIQVGDPVAELRLPIQYSMVVGLVAASRDWFPGHSEPAYAKAQGKADIYANTVFLQGFLDRAALSWAGPAWFVQRRTLTMRESVYPGDTLVATGEVTGKSKADAETLTVDLRITGQVERGLAIQGALTIALLPRPRQLLEAAAGK
jgi:acyl dehydratase